MSLLQRWLLILCCTTSVNGVGRILDVTDSSDDCKITDSGSDEGWVLNNSHTHMHQIYANMDVHTRVYIYIYTHIVYIHICNIYVCVHIYIYTYTPGVFRSDVGRIQWPQEAKTCRHGP